MHRFALPCLCGLALAMSGACGGAAPVDFSSTFHASGSGSGGSSGGGSSHSGSGNGGGSSNGGSSNGGSGGSSSGFGGSSGSSGSSGGDDGGGTTGDDASPDGPAPDAGRTALLCKAGTQSSTCQSDQSCCIAGGGLTGPQTAMCQSNNGCSGTTVHCGRTSDCPPMEICCGSGTTNAFTLTTTYTDVSCQATCPPAGALSAMVKYQFCAIGGSDCPSGKTCSASSTLTAYGYCH
jgi:hypothetical protein